MRTLHWWHLLLTQRIAHLRVDEVVYHKDVAGFYLELISQMQSSLKVFCTVARIWKTSSEIFFCVMSISLLSDSFNGDEFCYSEIR